MKDMKMSHGLFAVCVMALLLAFAVPETALGQSRGRARHNGDWSNRNWSKHNKKCGKFVNCHDARNGRLDNRGPRGDRVGNVVSRNRFRNRNNDDWRRRIVNRNRNNDGNRNFFRSQRGRHRDN